MFKINKTKINPQTLEEQLTNEAAGALATFSGWVRNHNEGQSVLNLEYEAYESLAEKEAAKIIAEAKARFAIIEAVCEHRVGVLAIGDMAVFVGVTAAHRGAAFDACRFIIDEIKLRLPIWKKETYQTGESGWVNCGAHEAHRHTTPAISEREFYAKQSQLPEFSGGRQKSLTQARVLVVGAGGLGCPALQHLAGAGVGHITVCDDDLISVDNLHRQNLFNIKDIGHNKAKTACEKLSLINPFVQIKPLVERLTASNAIEILENHDVVLDCTDNLKTKFILADACRQLPIALLQASIYQYEGQLLLSQNGEFSTGQCFRCLWPATAGLEFDEQDCVQNCAEAGIVGAVAGIMGSIQAFECIKLLMGMQSILHTHVLLFDLLSLQTTQLKVKQDPDCALCSNKSHKCELLKANQTVSTKPDQLPQNPATRTDLPLELSTEEFSQFTQATRIIIVDIREENEKDAHSDRQIEELCALIKDRIKLQNGSTLTKQSMPVSTNDLTTIQLDKTAHYLFFCQSGARSLKMVRHLRQRGFDKVSSLNGGLNNLARNVGLKV
jgi:molybdopterin/thiamine biosynthesis adenylyltransferase/molybdopterin synthase catalytic subunit/rhodanese-related sulfurtransferase